jgi:prepilin-type processing-associated H-X9-DG protein
MLPGPLYVGQGPQYTPDGKFGGGSVGNLANLVAPYLTSLSATSTGQKRQNMLECPSWLTKTKSLTAPSYVMNSNPKEFNYLAPFGRLDSGAPKSQPVSFGKLSSFPLSQTWLMMDADKEQIGSVAAGWKDQIPETPVHGSKRNTLYYDGHVSSVPTTQHSITSAP